MKNNRDNGKILLREIQKVRVGFYFGYNFGCIFVQVASSNIQTSSLRYDKINTCFASKEKSPFENGDVKIFFNCMLRHRN